MLQQALDFQAESDALYDLLKPLSEQDLARPTRFKHWTIDDILQHLHFFNRAAHLSVVDQPTFEVVLADLMAAHRAGEDGLVYTDRQLGGLKGRALLDTWHSYYTAMVEDYRDVDPKMRVKWAGPDMSVLSSISARLMETWSHAQAAYDLLGVDRVERDHIRNIVVMGNNTYGWTFRNRGQEEPGERPYLKLKAPSGAIWELNEPSTDNYIEGLAAEFCQVVTQTRNISDTALTVVGDPAARWMAVAQCFAGPVNDPPAPGTRFKES
jgi:uncharacterized protein (TIGR03084 family)